MTSPERAPAARTGRSRLLSWTTLVAALLAIGLTPRTAAQERQWPNETLTSSNYNGNHLDIDEPVDTPDASWMTAVANDPTASFGFTNPSGNLQTAAGAQQFRLWLRKNAAGGGNPNFDVFLDENGTQLTQLASKVPVPSDTGQLFTYSWSASLLSDISGATVQIRVETSKGGGGGNLRNVELGAIEWSAEIAAAGDTLTVTQTNVVSAAVQQGATFKVLQLLDLATDANDATLTDLTLTRLGSAVDADTTASGVKLWHDVDDNNAYSPGTDVQLSTSKTLSAGTVAFDAIGFTVTSGTPEKLLVTVDIAAAGTSTEGNTIGSSIADPGDVAVSTPDTVSISTPLSGNTHTIADSGDQLTIGQTSTGGGTLTKGTSNNVALVLDLTADNDTAQLTDLTVTRTGTAVDADTAAAGIKLWHDVNDDNAYTPGTDTQLSTSKSFTGGSVTFNLIGFTVTAGVPEKLLITYDIASGAGDTTIGAQIDAAGQATVAAPDSVALATTPLTGDSFTIAAAGDTLTVTQTNVVSAAVQQGATFKVLQLLDLAADANDATLTDLTLTRLGSAVDADTTASGVKLWHDVDDNNAYSPGTDVQLSTSKTLSAGTVAFDAIGFTVTSGTPEKLLVTVDIAAAGTSTEGNTIGSSIAAPGNVAVSAPDTVSISTPLSGNTHSIADSGDQLTIGQTSTGGGTLPKGTSNNVVLVLDLTADNDTAQLTDLTVTRTGTAVDADTAAAGIKLWHDVNDDNAYTPGTDAQLSTSKTFTGGTVTFNVIGFPVTAGVPEKLLITYDIASGAGDTTIGAQIDAAGQATVAAPDSVALATTPLTGDSFTIAEPAGDTLTASSNVPFQLTDPSAGQADVVMQYFQLDSDSSGDGSIELSSLTIDDLGDALAGDWDALEIFIDDDPDIDGAVLIGQVLSWNGISTVVSLNQGTAADRTVTSAAPKFVYVVYDINSGAAGKTIQSQVTVVDVQSPDNGHTGLDFRSSDPPLTILEPSADSTTVESNSAVSSSCRQITVTGVLTGDANDDGSTLVEYNTANDFTGSQSVACTAADGPSPRQCLITGDSVAELAPGNYWVRVTHSDPDTVLGPAPNPQVLGPVTLAVCGSDASAPTVMILAPQRDAVLGGTDRIKVQVYDEAGLAVTDPIQWSVDGDTVSVNPPNSVGNISENTNYRGTYCDVPDCGVYEFDLDTSGLTDGEHYLTVEVTDAATNVAVVHRAFRSRNLGATEPGGSGLLLRRTSGSGLCTDCHNLPTHSSQSTSTDYGNWVVECLDCHTPHSTRNIFLVREALRTPKSGPKTVAFHYDDAEIGGDANPGDQAGDDPARLSFLGDRSQTDGATPNAPFDDGICESCHTKTKFWRNTVDADHGHNAGTRCLKCHVHDGGFAGAGGGCLGCHSNVGDIGVGDANNRRPVLSDFDNLTGASEPRSHHVGNSGTYMGGQLTDYDCVVCHAEGRVNSTSGETESVAAFHGGDGGDTAINLKNVDSWDDDSPSAAATFAYDKEATNMPSKASPESWNSSNAEWRNQTSTALDPFCLSCHDTDGAALAFNSTDGGSDMNPFGDSAITNEYDQVPRDYAVPPTAPGRVVDIASMVTAGGSDLDTDAGRIAQGINDPPEGIYSRHAIRGQALSTYVAYQNIGGASDNTMYEGDPTSGGASLFTNMGTSENGPLWNDTSVMGCADCHTTDGANGSAGNAHGSDSEYLLKDANGLATEGTYGSLTYVCYRCHAGERYQIGGTLGDHTGSSSDFQDKVLLVGAERRDDGKGSSIFGLACANCHGGTGPDNGGGVLWGTIHGSSEILGVGDDGLAGTHRAYRFMNGASLRYYDPQGWTGTAVTCYTLGTADDWGGCTQHDKAGGQTFQGGKPLQRPIAY